MTNDEWGLMLHSSFVICLRSNSAFHRRSPLLYWPSMFRTQDLRVKEIVRLIEPAALKGALPITDASGATVYHSREAVKNILHQKDPRLLVVVGPCSIHDEKGALEYAEKLSALRKEFASHM